MSDEKKYVDLDEYARTMQRGGPRDRYMVRTEGHNRMCWTDENGVRTWADTPECGVVEITELVRAQQQCAPHE